MGDLAGEFEGFVGPLGREDLENDRPRRPSGDDGDDDLEAWMEQLNDIGQCLDWLFIDEIDRPFEDFGKAPSEFYSVIDDWLANGEVTEHDNAKVFGYSVAGDIFSLCVAWVEDDRVVYVTSVYGEAGSGRNRETMRECWLDLAQMRAQSYLFGLTHRKQWVELVRRNNEEDD